MEKHISSLKKRQNNYFIATATSIILGILTVIASFVRYLVFYLPSDRSKGPFQTADLFFYGAVLFFVIAFVVFFAQYKKESRKISAYFTSNSKH